MKYKLKECCKFIDYRGKTPEKSEQGYRLITAKNIKPDGYSDEPKEYIPKETYESVMVRGIPQIGDVLFTTEAPLGNVCRIPCFSEPFAVGQRLIVMQPNSKLLDNQYLVYKLRSNRVQEEIYKHSSGSTVKGIRSKELVEIEIDFPLLSEQQKISQELLRLEKIIELRNQELAALDDLIKARFVELFGDPVENSKGYLVKTLQELIDVGYITYHLDGNHGGDYPRSEEFVDAGVPYISANCIVNGEIDFTKSKYLTPERASKLRKGIAKDEDVLFAHNATVGPTVVLHTNEEKVILGTSLTAYRCNKDMILPNYLKTYMLSDGFVRQYSGEMKQTTRNQVPITVQKKYLFLVPSIEEQEQFADFVTQVDKSKVAAQQALDEAQLLFDSLMQKYFG